MIWVIALGLYIGAVLGGFTWLRKIAETAHHEDSQ